LSPNYPISSAQPFMVQWTGQATTFVPTMCPVKPQQTRQQSYEPPYLPYSEQSYKSSLTSSACWAWDSIQPFTLEQPTNTTHRPILHPLSPATVAPNNPTNPGSPAQVSGPLDPPSPNQLLRIQPLQILHRWWVPLAPAYPFLSEQDPVIPSNPLS
jgi:hypothetical protein